MDTCIFRHSCEYLIAVIEIERQGTPTLSTDSKVAGIVPSRLPSWNLGLTVASKRTPSLIRLVALGLIVVLAALGVTNPEVSGGGDPSQRVGARLFAENSGKNTRSLPRESVAPPGMPWALQASM